MEFKQNLKDRLQGFPLGKTLDELAGELPSEMSREDIEAALSALEEDGDVRKIGTRWRWMGR